VWVLQEIANSKKATIHAGRYLLHWDYFSGIISGLRAFKVDIFLRGCAAVKIIAIMQTLREDKISGRQPGFDLLSLLEETRDLQSTLESDKIYAVYAMARNPKGVLVDYSIPPADVFRHLATHYLSEQRDMRVLCHCTMSSEKEKAYLDLPSWVPDWTQATFVEPFYIRGMRASASKGSEPEISIDSTGKKLTIRGKLVSRITNVETKRKIPYQFEKPSDPTSESSAEQRTSELTQFTQHASEWLQSIMQIVCPDMTLTPELFDKLWRALMCNRTRDNKVPETSCGLGFSIWTSAIMQGKTPTRELRERAEKREKTSEEFLDIREQIGTDESIVIGNDNMVMDDVHRKEAEMVEIFSGSHSKWTYNRRFFKTEDERLGWTVDGVQVGDEIAVFSGVDFPFVLRREDNETFRVVGDAYVNGIMDGEVMDSSSDDFRFDII
jgi:hypothetical protein